MRQSGFALFQHRAGDSRDVAGHHRRTPHALAGDAGGFGDRLQHDAFQRALPKFAHQQADQEPLLGLGGAGEHPLQQLEPPPLRAATGSRDNRIESAVDFGHLQAGNRRRRSSRVPQRRIADPEPTLASLPREKRHDDIDLVGMQLPQKARQ